MASDDYSVPDLGGPAIWATPGLVPDPADPAAEPVAALTCVPSLSVHTHDTHPGAEPVDVIATTLLSRGFALLAALDLTALTELPALLGWAALLDTTGRHLRVTDPTGSLYAGDLSADAPTGWHQALQRRGLLVLLVAEISDLTLHLSPPGGVELRAVLDEHGIEQLVLSVHEQVFGGNHAGLGADLMAGLTHQPSTAAPVVAVAGHAPVAAGRLEFHLGTEFASLWGGGTVAPWRRRGVFQALVSHRAAAAKARGFRYLQVNASADSEPILRRLGFIEIATTTPFTHLGITGWRPNS